MGSILAFLMIASVVFMFIFLIWKGSDVLNVFLKMIFFGMTIWGIVSAIIVSIAYAKLL